MSTFRSVTLEEARRIEGGCNLWCLFDLARRGVEWAARILGWLRPRFY